jgi:hypothetical protein
MGWPAKLAPPVPSLFTDPTAPTMESKPHCNSAAWEACGPLIATKVAAQIPATILLARFMSNTSLME